MSTDNRNPRFAEMESKLLCTLHDHAKPVCIACCYTDAGYCQCDCHDPQRSVIGQLSQEEQ